MAHITLTSSIATPAVGQLIELTLLVDSQGQAVNAYQGTLELPNNLSVVEVRDTLSLIQMWIDKPGPSNSMSFSGITPGGFTGSGSLFSVIARVEHEGEFSINPSGITVLANDGLGSEADTTSEPLRLTAETSGATTTSLQFPEDHEPPEPFVVHLIEDKEYTDKAQVLGFSTSDTGSGVATYELFDGKNPPLKVSSPLILQRHLFTRTVIIRAVDYAGNSREASITVPGTLRVPLTLANGVYAGGLICVIITVIIILRRRHILARHRRS